MTAATHTQASQRERVRRAARRRRAALGIALAAGIVVALASASPAPRTPRSRTKSARPSRTPGQLSDRVYAQTARIVSLTAAGTPGGRTGDGGRRPGREAAGALARARDRARRRQSASSTGSAREYAVAVKQLDDRLVAIYESDTPD